MASSTTTSNSPGDSLSAIIMAAGKGTRMASDLPKVVHPVGGRPMVCAVVDACLEAGCQRIVAVVGYKQELVREALAGYGDKVRFAVQSEQLGTGHAVACAKAEAMGSPVPAHTFVLAGDGPLIRASTLRTLAQTHARANASATIATAILEDATGYGRIVRDAQGQFSAIVEQKNATPEQLKVREVNPSYYLFRTPALFEALERVGRNELTGEYYLTDTLAILKGRGDRVEVVPGVPPEDVLSINTLAELAKVDAIFRARKG
ncbi:MAG: NTP transferase domain-containing protein [Planctomycetota bacterium]|nr:NTP transferase domain-containing protein [Planctomycetota bacterium]